VDHEVPRDFAPSPSVRDWIAKASPRERQALTDLLVALARHPLPGGSLLRIMEHKDPWEIPMSYTVPFCDGECLLLYEIPIRAEEPIKLLLILP
jgi:hypothetical protein